MLLSGADILINMLIEQGCDTVFGYPGGQILDVYDSLYKYKDKINHILTAGEQGACHAADGYARATGRVGVVISTSGPGATNLVTGIATAYLDSVPLVAICGNVPTYQIGTDSFQEIDITGITLPITKHNYFVGSVNQLSDVIKEAFLLAQSGRPGPVLIDIPKDVQMAVCEYIPGSKVCKQEAFAAKDIRIQTASEIINSAKRPYVYFGGGIVSSHAQKEMLALAERIDAPIGSSMMGLAAIASNTPRYLGMNGMHGHIAASLAMNSADVIISLGVRFSDRVTGDRERFAPGARIVHIDIDGSELSKTVPATCAMRGDIKLTLEKLLPMIKEVKRPLWWKKIAEYQVIEAASSDNREGMTPKNILSTVNNFLGENTAVATDVGQHQMWSAQNLKLRRERRFISSCGLGTMGFGLGAAIGAYYGTGERSILITGDGSFGMSLSELATCVTYNIPVTILIMNNKVLGMVRQWQTLFFDKHYSHTELDRKTDFVSLAKSFGAQGASVDSVKDLAVALESAAKYNGPFVIDCAVDKDEVVLPMQPPNGTAEDIIVTMEDQNE